MKINSSNDKDVPLFLVYNPCDSTNPCDSGAPNDYPFNEVCAAVEKYAKDGLYCYQKFTCDGCGKRLMCERTNYFTMKGSCGDCGHITNIYEKGCNYLISNVNFEDIINKYYLNNKPDLLDD